MTLFTKPECKLCEQLKNNFDLKGMEVKVEVLEVGDAAALAHLAWHGLVETARKSLPILVLDDSSAVADFSVIEKLLMGKAEQCGIKYRGATIVVPFCDSGTCSLN
jgi:glutaredoxin 2